MKPRYLEFCGINSFSEPAQIDFTALAAFGIFGIFGDTGSGKSTILDCIGFALYGNIARSRAGSIVECVNFRCDKAYVIFEFEVVFRGERRTYRVERELKRKNGQQTAHLWECRDGALLAVAAGARECNERLTEIVGLEQRDFERCIALPQGEFAQFVRSPKAERVKLIARLFDLEAYGERLSRKVNKREAELSSEIKVLEAQLEPYAEITEASVAAQKAEIAALKERGKALKTETETARAREKALSAAAERRKEAEKLRAREIALSSKKTEMSALESELSRLEKASAVLEAAGEGRSARERAERAKDASEAAALRLKTAEEAAKALSGYDEEAAEALILRLTEQLSRARAMESDAARRKKALEELARVSAEYGEEAKKFADFSYEAERAALERQREALGSGDYFTYLEREGKAVLLKDEYAVFADELDALTEKHPQIAEDSAPLIEKYRTLAAAGMADDLRRTFEAREEARKAIEAALHALERRNGDYKVHRQRLQELQTRFAKLKEEAASYPAQETEVSAERTEKELSAARTARRDYAEKKKRSDAELAEAKLAAGQAAERASAVAELLKSVRERYRAACAAGGFSGTEDAGALLAKYGDAAQAKATLEAYKNECAAVSARLRELEGEDLSATDEDLSAARETLARLETEAHEITASLARKEGEYERAAAGHEKKCKLLHSLAEKRRDREVAERLKSLFYDNKFMEYVVEECLQTVSVNASERLLKLTGGHYFLRYEGGFYVGDNFNGGGTRPVSTLSGGETFLVSLSLALSLSAEICAKSLRPIEFFFLDEGFGTLDGHLVDTVLDSLEKLKNEHFSIGIISHVEELKHRIDKKLLVKKATEKHGSQIQAE